MAGGAPIEVDTDLVEEVLERLKDSTFLSSGQLFAEIFRDSDDTIGHHFFFLVAADKREDLFTQKGATIDKLVERDFEMTFTGDGAYYIVDGSISATSFGYGPVFVIDDLIGELGLE